MDHLFRIMRKKLGSANAAQCEFLKYKLSSLDVLDMTANELFREAGKGGWDHFLLELTLEEFSRLLNTPPVEKKWATYEARIPAQDVPPEALPSPEQLELPSFASAAQSSPPRRSKVNHLRTIEDHVIEFLRRHPWCQEDQVAAKIQKSDYEIGQILQELLEAGWIKDIEQDRKRRYALT